MGLSTNSSSIANSYATGSVSGNSTVGGLVGYNGNSSSVDNSYTTVTVSGNNNVGGLVGSNVNSSSIANSYATGTISGGSNVGGLVGANGNSSSVANSYTAGSVSGSSTVGGLVGYNGNSSSVANSYNTGSVSGNSGSTKVGGLVGGNYNSTIDNSYATGLVLGNANVGGFVGYDSGGTYIADFFDHTINYSMTGTGNNANVSGIAETTANLQTKSTFTNAGWDFNGLWTINGGTYPYLIWQDMDNGAFIGGTPSIPFLIHNVNQLQFMGYAPSDSFQLVSDIDASATSGWNNDAGFTPIGNSTTPFTGTFNANSYTISDLSIDLPTTNDVGLFGQASGSTIENVGLVNANITGKNNVGALVGLNINSSTTTTAMPQAVSAVISILAALSVGIIQAASIIVMPPAV